MSIQKRVSSTAAQPTSTVVAQQPKLKTDSTHIPKTSPPSEAKKTAQEEAFKAFISNNMQRFKLSQDFFDRLNSKISKL